jgi:hypothetical protein
MNKAKHNYEQLRAPYQVKIKASRSNYLLTDELVFPLVYTTAFLCDKDDADDHIDKCMLVMQRYLTALQEAGDVQGFVEILRETVDIVQDAFM